MNDETKSMADNGEDRPAALITGGSKGIGLALAAQFAANGHDLVLVARNKADLERAAGELRKDYSCSVTSLSLDLAAQAVFDNLLRSDFSGLAPTEDDS